MNSITHSSQATFLFFFLLLSRSALCLCYTSGPGSCVYWIMLTHGLVQSFFVYFILFCPLLLFCCHLPTYTVCCAFTLAVMVFALLLVLVVMHITCVHYMHIHTHGSLSLRCTLHSVLFKHGFSNTLLEINCFVHSIHNNRSKHLSLAQLLKAFIGR